MKKVISFLCLTVVAWANPVVDHPSGNRTTPPTIESVSPRAVVRGIPQELKIEGFNLAGTRAIYFSEPGVEARISGVKEIAAVPEEVRLGAGGLPSTIDLGPLPTRYEVVVELDVGPDANIGTLSFRLDTPIGTSPAGKVLVEPYYGERPDAEPNNNALTATKTFLPAILAGNISVPGDEDYFEITVGEGEQLVFEEGAWMIGSEFKALISILTPDHELLREFGRDYEEASRHWFAHRFAKGGTYYVRLSDYERSGGKNRFYRLKVGKFPIVKSAYPLGLQRGRTAEITLEGYNLPSKQVSVAGEPSQRNSEAVFLRPEGPAGKSFNELRLALEDYPEVESSGVNTSLEEAQTVAVPQTVNGRIASPASSGPVSNYFRFDAQKGDEIVLEVSAGRLVSRLDSLLRVFNENGNPIERATVRAVAQTNVTLRNWESTRPAIRLHSFKDLVAGDYVMMGSEITRVARIPRQPDEDTTFASFPPTNAGRSNPFRRTPQRLAFFGTSSEGQAMNTPVYKVQMHGPGEKFASNGLPLVRLYYANDDGGPGYGSDSRLHFTAPADGSYVVRLEDVHGGGGEDYPYRLTLRPPRPDFRLLVEPRNPNVPRGGQIPITILASRTDDFDGPIHVTVEDLPPSMRATASVIPPGQASTTLLVAADPDAELDRAVPFKVKATADIAGHQVTRWAAPEDSLKFISLSPSADVELAANARQIVLAPGEDIEITVSAKRKNGFAGRVQVEVRNLPPHIDIPEIGLSAVAIPAQEDSRSFHIQALPQAKPMEQWIHLAGRVRTRSPLQNSFAAEPILLKVISKPVAAGTTGSGD